MRARSRLNYVISVIFVAAMGACSGSSGCSGCGTSPLPAGGLPADQTIEGGAQVRVTQEGFQKLTALLPNIVTSALSSGPICIPGNNVGVSISGFPVAEAYYCNQNSGPSCTNGCEINVSLNAGGTSTQVVGNQLQVNISTSINTSIALDFKALGIDVDSCTLTISSNNLNGSFDISPGIAGSNGDLTLGTTLNSFALNLNFSGCGILSDAGNLLSSLLDAIPSALQSLLSPVVSGLIQDLLPNPLGLEGSMNVGALLASFSPGASGNLETRVVPGGYVQLEGSGMDLGIITGFNSDIDPSTRTGTRPDGIPYVSEPALCVPPIPPDNYGAAPYSLPAVTRSALSNGTTFALMAAGDFTGSGDGATPPDIKMGLSQTTLNLAGHHIVTSGAACLGIGTQTISQLNVGAIALLVPSLAPLESAQGNDPLLLVTRPQRALSFTVGDNTTASPAITIGVSHLEVDFYAFLYERYTRVFTLDLTLNVGIDLDFQSAGSATTITPTILGIDAADVTLTVLNSEFVKETPQQLEAVLPTIFNLVGPLLGNIPAITVPSFAGMSISNLSIHHVTTSQDNFIALFGDLGEAFQQDEVSHGTAKLVATTTPQPELVRAALMKQTGGAMPQVAFAVDPVDDLGRELEWTWNFNGGLFHPYAAYPSGQLIASDAAFAWQGKYTIGLQSRVKGNYTTASAVQDVPVIIDSVGPRVLAEQAGWTGDGGDKFVVPVWDVVSENEVMVAFGHPGEGVPSTGWTYQGDAGLDHATAQAIALNGEVDVYARDEAGNVTQVRVRVAPATAEAGEGCACSSSGAPGAGSIALFAIVGLVIAARRRRPLVSKRALRGALVIIIVASASSLIPACSCNHKQACEETSDCTMCPTGEVPYCLDHACICSTDIPLGHVGLYSHVAVAPDGTFWVSAYAESYGDLVVAHVGSDGRIADTAWMWVDGVPSGPVTVEGSQIRGGIAADGSDVGMYTSIQVASDGTPLVSYFDVDRGALKLASLPMGSGSDGSDWVISDVDVGTGSTTAAGGVVAGMYTSLTLDGTGRPGIAYLAHVNDGSAVHAEVRYAQAQVAQPNGPTDWQIATVDTADVPMDGSDIYPLPEGLGVFIDSARSPADQSPAVAYYDRGAGALKLAKYDAGSGAWGAPVVLDGGGSGSNDGWTPSLALDAAGSASVAYVNSTSYDLKFVTEGSAPVIVDNGYRIVGTTVDGLPKPTFDFVGDNAGLVLDGATPYIAYQDATTQELLLATRDGSGNWSHSSIAGNTSPWPGAYGFFAADALGVAEVVMSTWVIDQPTEQNWVQVFTAPATTITQ